MLAPWPHVSRDDVDQSALFPKSLIITVPIRRSDEMTLSSSDPTNEGLPGNFIGNGAINENERWISPSGRGN